jgi:hypothetical protein
MVFQLFLFLLFFKLFVDLARIVRDHLALWIEGINYLGLEILLELLQPVLVKFYVI